ncbi:phage holin family protein [Gracilibacillus caseinilyticus]|uniref:Phage holin family protein n=1 Tax=Gracilibacillus caseinilyticus TaxID=2932256 RepID=A0ABY4EV20_9BACI|nr:phage holin family protein [Gracilibacillus caseinilyticus]UOQ48265.1 phage holin family protein [Gracilibacillus caseinilyticus]
MRWILSLVFNALALMLIDYLFDSFTIDGFAIALLASVILAVLNAIVRPILVVLTLPITIVTLGLFLFVINAITLWFTQALLGDNFVIDGFAMALIAAILFSIMNFFINKIVKD